MDSNTLVIVIRTAVVMTLIFCVIVFFLLKKHGPPTSRHDGFLDVSATDVSQIYQLDITTEPEKLKDQDRVVFKVRKISS